MAENYWLDENDPARLRRRAADLARDGHHGMARQLIDRAKRLERTDDD